MQDPYLNSVLETIAAVALETEKPRLITVDELRAAGALDVPAAWRKSLGVERDLFSGLFDEDESAGGSTQATESEDDDDRAD